MNTWNPDLCGKYSKVADCEYGHSFAKILYCGREWCDVCGEDWSDIHQQRFSRWLPKAQKMGVMGQLVITVPIIQRESLRTKESLNKFRRSVIRSLKHRGYTHGLSRWHYYGTKNVGVWHPHLNILMPYGRLSPKELNAIKKMVADLLGVDKVVVYYSYTSVQRKKVHRLKYITRSTFTNCEWDEELADELYNFKNTHCWGNWDDLPTVWTLGDKQQQRFINLECLQRGVCPICGTNITWYDGVDKTDDLLAIGFVEYEAGWLTRSSPPIRPTKSSLDYGDKS